MKLGLGLLICFFVSVLVMACAIMIWYLSSTTEFSRKDNAPHVATPPPPKAVPVHPPAKPLRN